MAELAALHRWHEEAAGGNPRVVVLEGSAGLGKSRLLGRFADEVTRTGSVVLTGAAPPEVRVPYLPVLSALMPVLNDSDDPAAETLRDLLRAQSVDSTKEAAFASPELTLYLAVSELVTALGRRRPIVVAVDDLHWADDPTIDLLMHLAGALTQAGARSAIRVLLLVTTRPVSATSHIGRALDRLRHEDARELILTGLSELEVNDLLVALGPGRPTPSLLDPLRRFTNGNPLLLRTLWRRLVDEGAIQLQGSVLVPRDRVTDLVPGYVDLDQELRSQVDACPAEMRAVLDATAIIGATAPLDVVGAVMDKPPEHVMNVVRSHQGLGLAELRRGEVAFLHPQIAVLVVSALDEASRHRMHARVVEARTAAPPVADIALELLDHVLGAGPLITPSRRVELATAAGSRAMRLGAWAAAAAAYDAAAEAIEVSDPRFDEVQWGAALAHFRNHDRRACERHAHARIERSRAAGDLVAWGEALELLTRMQLTLGAEVVGRRLDDSAIREFLDSAGDREPKLRARLTGALAELHFAAFDFDEGLSRSEQAREIATEVGDEELAAMTAFVEGIQRLGRLQVREAEACFTESIGHADRLADSWIRAYGRGRLPLVLWLQGRFAEAWAAVDRALETAVANHNWAEQSIVHAAATGLATSEGRFQAAEGYADEATRTFARSEYAYTPGVLFPALATARALRGNRDGAAAALADWRAQGAAGLPSAFELFIAAAAGDIEATRTLLAQRPWRSRPGQPVDLGTLAFASGYVDVADLLDEPGVATPVVPVLEEARRRGVRFLLTGASSLSRLLATAYRLEGEDIRAKELLAEAEEHLVAAPSRILEAEIRYERALWAAAEGDASSSASLAAAAAAVFDEIGALAGLARAEAVRRRVTGDSVAPARRTRVILITDLVGSTALNVAAGDDRYLELLREHDRAIRALVRNHRGVQFKHTGDGLCVWFDHGDDAAACALAIQPAMDDLNRSHPAHALRVRCGMAAGEPIAAGGDLFGVAMVRAARVCAQADTGEVLAAAEVMALAPRTRSEPYGSVALKGLPAPVVIHRLRATDGDHLAQ